MHLERLKTFIRECRYLTSGQEYQAGGRSVLVFRGTCKCGVPVGQMCECCVSTVSTQLDAVESGTCGTGKGGCDLGRGVRRAKGPCHFLEDP